MNRIAWMKKTTLMAIIVTACCASVWSDDEGWTPLFNGKDLSGWAAVNDAKFEVDPDAQTMKLVTGMGSVSRRFSHLTSSGSLLRTWNVRPGQVKPKPGTLGFVDLPVNWP